MDFFKSIISIIPGITSVSGLLLVIISIVAYILSQSSDEIFEKKILELRKVGIKPSDFPNTKWTDVEIAAFFKGANEIPRELIDFMKNSIIHEIMLRNRKLIFIFIIGLFLVILSFFIWNRQPIIQKENIKIVGNSQSQNNGESLKIKDKIFSQKQKKQSIKNIINDEKKLGKIQNLVNIILFVGAIENSSIKINGKSPEFICDTILSDYSHGKWIQYIQIKDSTYIFTVNKIAKTCSFSLTNQIKQFESFIPCQ